MTNPKGEPHHPANTPANALPQGAESREAAAMPFEFLTNEMLPGDKVTVGFEDGSAMGIDIVDVEAKDYIFGSDDVLRPKVTAIVHKEGVEDQQVELAGGGNYTHRMSSGIFLGNTLATYDGEKVTATEASITDIRAQRPDEQGVLREFAVGQPKEVAPSFGNVLGAFQYVEGELKDHNFSFGEGSLLKVKGDHLMYASNQGAGSGVEPQKEIYSYDAANQTLRALRYMPMQGMMQMALFTDVSKQAFQEATNAYNDDQKPDWTSPNVVGSNHLYHLSESKPFTTYTWMTPSVESPMVTVVVPPEAPGSVSIAEKTIGKNVPSAPPVVVDIDTSETQPQAKIREHSWWVDDFENWKSKVEAETSVEKTGKGMQLTVGEAEIGITTTLGPELGAMIKSVSEALGEKPADESRRNLGGKAIEGSQDSE